MDDLFLGIREDTGGRTRAGRRNRAIRDVSPPNRCNWPRSGLEGVAFAFRDAMDALVCAAPSVSQVVDPGASRTEGFFSKTAHYRALYRALTPSFKEIAR
jgi:hypothetical protein